MHFSTENVVNALNLMWKGMLAIFIAIGIIWLAVFVMGKVGESQKKKRLLKEKQAAEKPPENQDN